MTRKQKPASEESPVIGVLRQAIRDSGLPIPELSEKTGVSNPQIYRFLNGERSLTLPAVEKLAAFLGLRLAKVKGK